MVPRFTVNGKTCELNEQSVSISYEQIEAIVGRSGVSVTWKRKNGSNGTIVQGQSVTVTDGMVFNAIMTNRA